MYHEVIPFKVVLMKKNYFGIFSVILSVSLTTLWLKSYLGAIFDGWDKYIVMCVDFGQYLNDALRYSKEGIILLNTIEVSKEPWFF